MNIWRSKLVKSRTVRGSVQPIAATVAATPASGTPASQNSRASAAAVAELIKGLDFVFEQLDFESMVSPPVRGRGCFKVCMMLMECYR